MQDPPRGRCFCSPLRRTLPWSTSWTTATTSMWSLLLLPLSLIMSDTPPRGNIRHLWWRGASWVRWMANAAHWKSIQINSGSPWLTLSCPGSWPTMLRTSIYCSKMWLLHIQRRWRSSRCTTLMSTSGPNQSGLPLHLNRSVYFWWGDWSHENMDNLRADICSGDAVPDKVNEKVANRFRPNKFYL